jgi:hypothetical protein
MVSDDPVRELAHDHVDLNRRVLELETYLTEERVLPAFLPALQELREHLFLHFAREEEGLFPLVAEWIPELSDQVLAMVSAHDAVCGALARMIHMTSAGADAAALNGLLARFQAAYGDHSRHEAGLLQRLDGSLDAGQRTQLAELVHSL